MMNFQNEFSSDTFSYDYKKILHQHLSYYSCFISYSHSDKAFAHRLCDQLRCSGIYCWLDEHQILPGDDIYAEVRRGLEQCDKVLLCASKASLNSSWVERELDQTIHREMELTKKIGKTVLSIIPLNLDGYLFKWDHAHASILQKRFAADFVCWESDNSKFESSFRGVKRALRTGDNKRERLPESRRRLVSADDRA